MDEQTTDQHNEHVIDLGKPNEDLDARETIVSEIAKTVADLGLFISTRGGKDSGMNVYREFRKAYKEESGPYSSVYLPSNHESIDAKEEYADSVVHDGSSPSSRDLIMIGNAKTFIAVSGDFIGSEASDVLQAINSYGVPVIIYEPGDNTKLVEEIKRVSKKTLESPLLYVASDLESFKDIVKTIEKLQESMAVNKHS